MRALMAPVVDGGKVERERGVTAASLATAFSHRAKWCPLTSSQPYRILLRCQILAVSSAATRSTAKSCAWRAARCMEGCCPCSLLTFPLPGVAPRSTQICCSLFCRAASCAATVGAHAFAAVVRMMIDLPALLDLVLILVLVQVQVQIQVLNLVLV